MSNDDWKGEHFIRGRRLTDEERSQQNRNLGGALWNAQRRKAGKPHPGAKAHSAFAKRIFRDAKGLTI